MKNFKILFLIISFSSIFNHISVNKNIRTLSQNVLTFKSNYFITEVDMEKENNIYAERV